MMFRSQKAIFTFLSLITFQTIFPSIRSLIESTYVPSNIYVGGALSNYLSSEESSLTNPALIASLRRNRGGGLGYSTLGGIDVLWAQAYIPIPVGSLSLNGSFLEDQTPPAGNKIQRYYSLSAGYARQFTSRFSFGFYFKPAYAFSEGNSFFSLAIDPSFMYNTKSKFDIKKGWGIYDLSFYLLSNNLGINISDQNQLGPSISFHLGTQFVFYKKYDLKAAFNGELIGVGSYDSLPARFGLHMQYQLPDFMVFNLGLGYALGTKSSIFNGFTLGGGFAFDLDQASFSVNYAFLRTNDTTSGNLHTVFLRFDVGYFDKTPPDVQIKQDLNEFSPNWDGESDYVNFQIQVKDVSSIKKWSLMILDKNKRPIRRFKSDNRDFEKDFGFKDFFVYLFKRQRYLSVPSQIRWDGTADPIALEKAASGTGRALPDGVYTYRFLSTDEWGNESKPFRGTVKIDRTPPDIKVSALSSVFSPNGDGILEKVTILHERRPTRDDVWSSGFFNPEGEPVKSYQWQGVGIPTKVVWDGKNDQGEPVPEGLYTYRIQGSDSAGNRSESQTQEISLIRKHDLVDVKLSSTGLSPNDDGVADELTITTVVPNSKGIQDWKLSISKKPYDQRTKKAPGTIMEWTGSKEIPASVVWDGKEQDGKISEDDTYYVQFSVRYGSGNHPVSLSRKVTVDTKSPEVDADASLSVFSPDGDGKDDEEVFSLSIEDESPIREYEFRIYEVSSNDKGRVKTILFKRFKGEQKYPEKIFWAGKSDKGSLVESATEYRYQLVAIDQYGNRAASEMGSFETDILVLVTERGLKIRISNVEFDLGKATLKPKTKDLIKKVHRLLSKYRNYNVKVEGHTDDLGEETFNLRLSENRARAVVDHLIQLGTAPERLSYQGIGEMSPFLPNRSWYNRSRNRRVEFLLLRN